MQEQYSTEREDIVFTEAAKNQLEKINEDIYVIMKRRAIEEASGRGGPPIEVTATDVKKAWEWLRGKTERSGKARSRTVLVAVLLIALGIGWGISTIILELAAGSPVTTGFISKINIFLPVALISMGLYIVLILITFKRGRFLREEIQRLFGRHR